MNEEQRMDKRLYESLQQLRQVPTRDADAAARGRAKFMAEVEVLGQAVSKMTDRRRNGWYGKLVQPLIRKERFSMIAMFTSIFVALVLFFSGAGVTAFAAQGALPGDALYSVKTTTEDLRLAITASDTGDASLYNEFVQRRVGEIDSLASKGRYADIPGAATRLENQVRQMAQLLVKVSGEDPSEAQQLATRLRESLAQQVQLKSHIQNGQPEIEFLGIVEAMTDGVWTVSGKNVTIDPATELKGDILVGDLVKVEASGSETLTAKEIELIDNGDEHDIMLNGIIESMDGQSWVVAGQTVLITPQTQIKDTVAVGDFVTILGVLTVDSRLVASHVQLAADNNADDTNCDGENCNEDDNNGDDDEDANGNFDNDDNGNCDGENCNGIGNDDDGEDHDDNGSIQNNADDDDDNGSISTGGDDDDHDDDGNGSSGGDDEHDDNGTGSGGGDDGGSYNGGDSGSGGGDHDSGTGSYGGDDINEGHDD